jgi:hypothetical protein
MHGAGTQAEAVRLLLRIWSQRVGFDPLLTDTLDGDDGAIEDGDVGGKRPNDQRVRAGLETACIEGRRGRGVWLCVARL